MPAILRTLLALLVSAILLDRPAGAQTYPDKTIRMLIPLAAGSAVDVVARIVADKMAEQFAQGFVVENQPGAAGLVGMRSGARAKPDGYTMLAVNDSVMTMLPHMKADAGYDPVKDFVPVTQLVRIHWALVAHPSAKLENVGTILARAREQPDSLTFASGGIGSPQHMAMEILMHASGAKFRHVPYRGATQGLNDVVSGHVPMMFVGLPMPNEFIRGGQLTLVGAAGEQRLALFADRPTIAESGVKGFSFYTWGGLLVPAGTPPDIVQTLNRAAVSALQDSTVKQKLVDLGYEVVANSPADFAEALMADFSRMGKIIKAADIRVTP